MSLEKPTIVDAIGIEKSTGAAVLTIADSWDWEDEGQHLGALQDKINTYFEFIEDGQVWESYPDARGRQLVIEIVTRLPLSEAGRELLGRAAEVGAELGVQFRTKREGQV